MNKPTGDEAARTVRDLRAMLRRGPDARTGGWAPPVVRTVATTGEGVDALHAAVRGHGAYLTDSGEIRARRRIRAEAEISALAIGTLPARLAELPGQDQVATLAEQVVAGELDPHAATDRVCAALTA